MGERTAFFYGTLMVPQVLQRVTSLPSISHLTITPAVLKNYCRRHVRYADYPGITPQAGSSVRGTFVTGLSDRDIARLDTFEGNQYERVKVLVWKLTIEGGGNGEGKVDEDEKIVASEQVEAETYVFMDLEDLEEEEWDYETFRREKMHRWIGSNEEYEDLEDEDDEDEEEEGAGEEEEAKDLPPPKSTEEKEVLESAV